MTGLRRLAIPAGDAVLSVLGDVAKSLEGGEPFRPVAPGAEAGEGEEWATQGLPAQDLPDDLAVAVATSGSTGITKLAMLTAHNLMSSAAATHDILGGPGRWLLALPGHHIAGLQVLVRSILAGTSPCTLDPPQGFTAPAFVTATEELHSSGAQRAYTALVPTQLTRLLDDPSGTEALASYDGVLVGGAALSSAERGRASAAGVRVVSTYGMSETAGGCVYDGVPLPVSQVHIDNDRHVVIGGATVALGYLGQSLLTRDAFAMDADGVRWFRTDDLGVLDDDGRLQVRGRADDLINTGGIKVAPGPIEDAAVRFVPGVVDAVVVGTPHPTWGEAVSLTVVMRRGAPTPTVRDVRTALRGILPDHALPQRVLVFDAFPLRGPGKPDRRALAAAFGETLMRQQGS